MFVAEWDSERGKCGFFCGVRERRCKRAKGVSAFGSE